MIDETELRDALLMLTAMNKKVYDMALATLNEVAAVREAVRGLDPTFSDVLAKRQSYYQGSTDQLCAEIIQEYDSLFQRVKDRLIL
jgi:hypothetical protein